MNRIATVVLLVTVTVIVFLNLSAQDHATFSEYPVIFGQSIALTKQDSIKALSIPDLMLPENYKERSGRDLPFRINNADLPFFRPIFSQGAYANCGQSAGIGYNFTYEINRVRGLSADVEANQYTPQFTWNFMNGGEGWYGVSYFHSFDILKRIGNPSVQDYGGMYAGGDQRWMSGYEWYYNSMHNRVEEVYAINVSTIEGLNTLKYWLYDHLEGAESGGLACYYAGSPYNYTNLPNDSPEAGKHVIRQWSYPATHAMTIVGYNDSIRFDYNNDGKYTNHIDINEDGNVDMKDWEIGGLLFANSYGPQWADSGFCYMMYNTLAQKYGEGGIWNQTVNVLKVNPDYIPSAGVRLKIKHNSRNKLKLVAGISYDTALNYPTKTIDLPIINFQGGNKIMQGVDTISGGDELELEFDITSLLGELNNDNLAKFFIEIYEKDPDDIGFGEIIHYGIVDYSDDLETVCINTPETIKNNGITSLSIVKEIHFGKVEILTEELPAFRPGIPFNFQFEAGGGQQPYEWSLLKDYSIKPIDSEFPLIDGQEIEFSNLDNDFVSVDLPFLFPFYGDSIEQINIHVDGFVTFENIALPYPYFIGESTMLVNNKMIAPFLTDLIIEKSDGENVTIEGSNDFFYIKWNASHGLINGSPGFIFGLKIFPSGEIETYYESAEIPDGLIWNAGVSNGDQVNYTINPVSSYATTISNKGFAYDMLVQNQDIITLNSDGELVAILNDENLINQLHILVTDKQDVSVSKQFQLSTGILLNFELTSGDDDRLDFGETACLKAIIKNISADPIENLQLNYSIVDEFVTLLDEELDVGTLSPGESKEIDSSLVFKIANDIADQHMLVLNNALTNTLDNWQSESIFRVNAPILDITDVTSNGLTWLEPGITNPLTIQIDNSGHSILNMVEARFVSESNYIQVIGDEIVTIDILSPNKRVDLVYRIKADPLVSSGINVPCRIEYYKEGNFICANKFDLQIGKNAVLLVDMDPEHTSIEQLKSDLEELNLSYIVSSVIPNNLTVNKSVFVLLGTLFSNHELSYSEGLRLSEYLNNNGNLYLESRASWVQYQTPVHSMFQVEIISTGNYFPIDTIYTTQNDTTSQKILKFNHQYPYSNHYFIPEGTSFSILNFTANDSACVVANKSDNYNTVASIVEYGSLTNTDTSFTKIDYLYLIADFFELYKTTLGVDEHEEKLNNDEVVNVFPNPFKDIVNIQVNTSAPAEVQIFNSMGQLVFTDHLKAEFSDGSFQNIIWDGRDLNGRKVVTGIYYVYVRSGKLFSSAKIIYL